MQAKKGSDKPHWVDVYVGRRIRNMRHALDMSQTALGEAVGVSFQQVQKYEKGRNRIACGMLWEIARVLHVQAADLLPRGNSDRKAAEENYLVS